MAALWLALAGCGAAGAPHHAAARPSPAVQAPAPIMVPATPVVRSLDVTGAPPAPSDAVTASGEAPMPVRLQIPAIKVSTAVGQLGLNGDGTIEVPKDPNQAGWYTNGPAPGEVGPAVILGHLDSATGPAVFYHLAQLRPGSQVLISREDGSSLTFVVQRVASFPVDAFPSDQVYGATTDAELRLITCGGTYSLVRGRYLMNVVVFAVLQT